MEAGQPWAEEELGASPRMAPAVVEVEARVWRRAEAGVLLGARVPMRKRAGAAAWVPSV